MHLTATHAHPLPPHGESRAATQTPGDIIFLSAADSELALFSAAHASLRRAHPADTPSLRLTNLLALAHSHDIDAWTDATAAHARLIVARILGGVSYWSHGVERLTETCRARNIPLALLPGDDVEDRELAALSTMDAAAALRLWRYCIHGGAANAEQFLRFAASLAGAPLEWREPAPLPRAGIYWPGENLPDLPRLRDHWAAARRRGKSFDTPVKNNSDQKGANPTSEGDASFGASPQGAAAKRVGGRAKEMGGLGGIPPNQKEPPVVGVIFYRALALSGMLTAVEALITALQERGLNPLPIFVASLKDKQAAEITSHLLESAGAELILNSTAFAASSSASLLAATAQKGIEKEGAERSSPHNSPSDGGASSGTPPQNGTAQKEEDTAREGCPSFGTSPQEAAAKKDRLAGAPPARSCTNVGWAGKSKGEVGGVSPHMGGKAPHMQTEGTTPFAGLDCPVLQIIFAGNTKKEWQNNAQGLSPRDLAMNIALPEIDGRLITRAVAFKAPAHHDPHTECDITTQEILPDRINHIGDLAAAWLRLRHTPPPQRKIALILANYPNRDGRLGNGVGLDTPASILTILHALKAAGYTTADIPPDPNALMRRITDGPTNAAPQRNPTCLLPRAAYAAAFSALPQATQDKITARWGEPDTDPFYIEAQTAFAIPAFRCGNILIALQPARGYNIDPEASYHDPHLPPPHSYLAFYAWLRRAERIHAAAHIGKHGNLEWLPGKALCLAADCFPDAVFGPTPHLYPFIVNDPGEGAQAKRRIHAAIIDHMTPPMTRAESYGALEELENLLDEYHNALGLDPRRALHLGEEILAASKRLGLDKDCGVDADETAAQSLARIDNHLCELKEMQIRDGLHIFGVSPQGEHEADLLTAFLRIPRGQTAHEASLLQTLAKNLHLPPDFDPLRCEGHLPWQGERPQPLAAVSDSPWRSHGDTLERLELLARALLSGEQPAPADWQATHAVLAWTHSHLRPALAACGPNELRNFLHGLNGRFIPPGPSGAPTRARPDVLPTGRNFYSLDSRALPTPTAWRLGFESAQLLIDHYRHHHGHAPRAMALSLWGTANMRTGGDDIAQALALMGARPTWDTASGRVTGFEILPLSLLARPRVDVTLRVSGFFRDAFPTQVELLHNAAAAVMELREESPADNPLAAHRQQERAALLADGMSEDAADAASRHRVFGPPPGAYGAGLQALIDEGGWQTRADLAHAYRVWSAHAYGGGATGERADAGFRNRLAHTQAVVQNQDNREHDILDSDDYYQFEGGLAAAVEEASGAMPSLYHNDHSRPHQPKIRTLAEELGRVVRARAANPKWIKGVMRHGYKGGFEMAATVDYLFAFAATTNAVSDHHFDALFDAYLKDDATADFLRENNPQALLEMTARFREAIRRELWHPTANTTHQILDTLANGETP